MKIYLLIIFGFLPFTVLLLPSLCLGQETRELRTLSGQKYFNPVPISIEGNVLKIRHHSGVAELKINDLPPKVVEKAKEFLAAQQKEEWDKVFRGQKSIKEVRTDMLSFVGKVFYLEGTLDVSDYYSWGYRDAEVTHFSFKLTNGEEGCHLYMECEKAEELRKQTLAAGGELKGIFAVTILKDRYQLGSELLAEIVKFNSPPKEALTKKKEEDVK